MLVCSEELLLMLGHWFLNAGTAVCLYLQNGYLLAGFWVVLGGGVGLAGYNFVSRGAKK